MEKNHSFKCGDETTILIPVLQHKKKVWIAMRTFCLQENGLKEDFKDSTLTQHHEVVKVLKNVSISFSIKKRFVLIWPHAFLAWNIAPRQMRQNYQTKEKDTKMIQ